MLQYTPVEYTADEGSTESSPRLPSEEIPPPPPPKPIRYVPDEETIVATSNETVHSVPPPPPPSSFPINNNSNNHHIVEDDHDQTLDTFQNSPMSTPSPARPTTLSSPAYSARPYPGRQESSSPRIISPKKASGDKIVRPKPQYPPGSPKRVLKDSTTEMDPVMPRVGRVKPNNRPISIVSPESSRVTTDPEPSPDSKLFIKRLNEQKNANQAAAQKNAAIHGSPQKNAAIHGSPKKNAAIHGSPQKNAAIHGSPQKNAAIQGSPQKNGAIQGSPQKNAKPVSQVDGKPKPEDSAKSEADTGEKNDKTKKSSVWYEYGCV